MICEKIRRPVLRYHGGKWRIAPWIISHFPDHRVYVEPYGGAASVLMRKPRSKAEVYNDLDNDVVNVFRVLRDPFLAKRLAELLYLTPWSRVEFLESYQYTDDPIEQARRTILRSFMAHGSTHRRAHQTGFRSKSWVQRSPASSEWIGYPEQIQYYVERLRGVIIEHRPALKVIMQHDSPETLFYVDPPYLLSTRSSIRSNSEAAGSRAYAHNLNDEEHIELSQVLREVVGMVIISGYPSTLYEKLYHDWQRIERKCLADRGVERTEVLWLSPKIKNDSLLGPLFEDERNE